MKDQGSPASNLASELEQLQIQELKLKIKDLGVQWWRKPAYIGSVATTLVAVIGLAWAMTTGFFDVTKRELEVTKRELRAENRDLQEKRDAQTALFEKERGSYLLSIDSLKSQTSELEARVQQLDESKAELEKEVLRFAKDKATWKPKIDSLKAQAADLEKRAHQLDQPILTYGWAFYTDSVNPRNWDGKELIIYLVGTNLGKAPGSSVVDFVVDCPTFATDKNSHQSNASIEEWSEEKVTIKLNSQTSLKPLFDNVLSSYPKSGPDSCELALNVKLSRRDRKLSNVEHILLTGAAAWTLRK